MEGACQQAGVPWRAYGRKQTSWLKTIQEKEGFLQTSPSNKDIWSYAKSWTSQCAWSLAEIHSGWFQDKQPRVSTDRTRTHSCGVDKSRTENAQRKRLYSRWNTMLDPPNVSETIWTHCVLLSRRNCSHSIKKRNWHHPQVTDSTTVGFQIRPDDGTENFQLTYNGEEPISLDSHQETTTCYPSHILSIWNCFYRTVFSEISIYVHFKGSKWLCLKV